LQQLVHVKNERVLFGHGLLIAIQAINHDRAGADLFNRGSHAMREFAR
jgi:hypothetical protein